MKIKSIVSPLVSPVVLGVGRDIDSWLGPEIVVNRHFDADATWNKGVGWTIGSGKASCDGTQVATSNLFQANSITQFKTYRVQFELSSVSAGSIHYASGTTVGTDRTADGIYVEYIYQDQITGGNIILAADASFVGSVDHVSVREVRF